MDGSELRAALQAEGIRPDACDLSGEGKSEAYVLREEPFGWSVFYSERGMEQDTRTFGSETEACDFLLTKLRADPTTR
ncbi:hypothetical protein M8312_12685 [Sphingomonas sp. KRR8]|uniref:hypothetical protein n=1 Tax=Sphingomonas sp. KRR8 TaxID=2942996 RepID=UPI00202192C2|nr:hypothetical protein [Sphingomonas sp. KRR8]URD60625.1 hypothetical protein M8312_12685 [Sphingomonas sp. KRR8]